MRIKSLIREENITLKDLLLKKYTDKAITSEKFMEIPAQPANTCPIIDKAIEENKDTIIKLDSVESDGKSYVRVRVIEDECETNCAECLQNNVVKIEQFNSSLQDAQEYLQQINELLEVLRKNCENLRLYGHDLKELFWKCYEDGKFDKEAFLLLKEKKPKDEIQKKRLEKVFDKIDVVPPKFEDTWCKHRCYNNRENDSLENYFSNMYVDVIFSDHIENAFNNFYIIDEWVSCVESFMESFDNENLINLEDGQIKEYLELYNLKQKNLFLSKFKAEGFNLVNLDNELKEYVSNTENLVIAKKIKDLESEANNIISEFNNLIKTEDYKILCKEYSQYFDKLKSFKEKSDDFMSDKRERELLPHEIKKIIEINKVLIPLRTTINALYSNLMKNGPQEFSLM